MHCLASLKMLPIVLLWDFLARVSGKTHTKRAKVTKALVERNAAASVGVVVND